MKELAYRERLAVDKYKYVLFALQFTMFRDVFMTDNFTLAP